MNIDKIDNDLIISKEYKGCYLLYTTKEYYLFKPANNTYDCTKIDIDEKPTDVEDSLLNSMDINRISNNSGINKSLRFLALHLEIIGITDVKKQLETIGELFYDLSEVMYSMENSDDDFGEFNDFSRSERFKAIDNELMIAEITEISKEISRSKTDDIIGELFNAFKFRTGVKKAERDLGNYLNTECGIILRKNTHDLYKLDIENNGYNSTTIDEIIAELTDIFGEKNLFKTTDVENAVDFISERLTPEYDIVKFSNGLYSMKEHKLINPEKPIFTLVETPYAYNPDAKPVFIVEYLESTFERETQDETAAEIKGVLQVIGYLFTSGNAYNVLIFLIGIGGGGKGTLASIIAEIFKGKTTQLDFSKIEKDIHATSILIGKHLNLVRETRNGIVDDNTMYKLLSGNDSIDVNPKNQHPYELPPEEVPKSVMNANNLPNFRNPEISILQRFVLIEFKRIFRNTDADVRNLAKLISESDADMEWLIYNSLEAYKEMVESDEDFILRLSEEETLELVYKHSKPLNYLISKLIAKHDKEAYETEVELSADAVNGETEFVSPYIVADELNRIVVYLSKNEGIQIPLDEKTGKASSRKLLNAIKDEFDLYEYYIETANGSSKKYSTVNKRINGKQQRVYPELIKTAEYNDLLSEMKAKEIETQRTKEF